jgi:Activator of Hsp90 ATPase homolog 1-like protein
VTARRPQPAGPVTVERRVAASPATVFSFFTDRDRWLRWQGVDATIEPVPGGAFRMNVRGDGDGTLVRLTHHRLPPEAVDAHRVGWAHYIGRLAVLAGGGDPGFDPLAVGV